MTSNMKQAVLKLVAKKEVASKDIQKMFSQMTSVKQYQRWGR